MVLSLIINIFLLQSEAKDQWRSQGLDFGGGGPESETQTMLPAGRCEIFSIWVKLHAIFPHLKNLMQIFLRLKYLFNLSENLCDFTEFF